MNYSPYPISARCAEFFLDNLFRLRLIRKDTYSAAWNRVYSNYNKKYT